MKEIYSEDGKVKALIDTKSCGGYLIDYITEIKCLNHNFIFVKKKSINGNYLLRKQCKNCGESQSNGLKNNLVSNILELPDFDENLYKIKEEYWREFYHKKEVKKNQEKWNEYQSYLQSDKWLLKRKKVLERDKHLCQACLTNKANQVHHLTYQNIYDEPLFELISVCPRCHDKIESKKRLKEISQ